MDERNMQTGIRITVIALLFAAALCPSGALAATAAPHVPVAGHAVLNHQLLILALWALAGAFLLLLALGLTNRVVIFYDGWDAFWAVVPLISVVVSVIIVISITPDTAHGAPQVGHTLLPTLVLAAGGFGALIGGIMTLYNAVKYNRNLPLGLLIGVCKLVISMLLITLSLNYLLNMNDKRTRNRNLFTFLVLGGIAWLWLKLVNGERVYERKGWTTPK